MKEKISYPKEAGIYKLTCEVNGKVYIGKSFNINQRLNKHKYDSETLKDGGYFHRALIKHGWDSFKVEILEIIKDFDKSKDGTILLEKEAAYIRSYNTTNEKVGYNICEYSTDRVGLKHTEETKKKMSNSHTGKKLTEETKKKMSKPKSQEIKDKIRKTQKGRTLTDEHKENIRRGCLGRVRTKEHQDNLNKAQFGKKHSEEAKQRMSVSQLRRFSKEVEIKL